MVDPLHADHHPGRPSFATEHVRTLAARSSPCHAGVG